MTRQVRKRCYIRGTCSARFVLALPRGPALEKLGKEAMLTTVTAPVCYVGEEDAWGRH